VNLDGDDAQGDRIDLSEEAVSVAYALCRMRSSLAPRCASCLVAYADASATLVRVPPSSPNAPYRERSSDRSLPVLTALPRVTGCDVAWDALVGAGRVRRCARCSKQVFNLASLSLADAEVLVCARLEGDARLHRREDGTVLVGDCSRGLWRGRIRRLRLLARVILTVVIACGVALKTLGTKVTTAVATDSIGFGS
jgi:hypothetical protein